MDPKLFQPPVLIGERVVWLGSGSGVPQSGYVRWIGRLPEMGPGWTLGLELDNPLPYGGIDGTWGNRHLFTCETKHGLLVPATKTMKESELFQHNQENGWNYVKPKKRIPETPFEAVTKFCPTTDLVTCDIPRPAVRRKKHLLLQQIEKEKKPIAPKRRTKLLAKQSLLPKIYESSPTPPINTLPCALSSSSLNGCGTIKSLESHTTFDSFPASYGTLKSSVSVYGTLKSSISECDISKYTLSASLCSLTSFNTLRTCRSDEYSDYQWFDAKDKCEDIFKCKYHSLEKGDASIKNKCHIIEGQQIRLIESQYCRHIEIKTPDQNGVNFERMNGIKRQKKVCEDDDDDDSSYEDATSTIERTYSESGSCPRKDKTTSGFFSFLRWFKKNKESADERSETLENDCNTKQATVPSSPEFVRNISSSCGSIDTIFSTATVNSFAFVAPTLYRPFGYANPVEKGIIVEPETDTYRNRIVHRDRIRELDKNLTLRKKYHLYSSDTLLRTTPETSPFLQRKNTEVKGNVQESENIRVLPKKNSEVKNQSTNTENQVKPLLSGSSERKKRKAPDPPASALKDSTLSNSLDSRSKNTINATDNEEQINVKRTRHRRTVSDSAKDKKAGAFCHVKGKRKAPLPPTKLEATSSLGRKKRPAPQPPQEPRQERRSTIGYLTPEEKERLIANIDKLRAHAEKKSMEQASAEQVICNDSLRLEKGVLRPNKDITKTGTDTNSEKKTAPVSPRPWYKRSITNKDSVSGLRKDIFKSLEKKKEREKEKTEEWMPEVGFPRITSTSTNNRFSIFSRSEEKKAEGEKRKSQISMLANISELDREAAEIVQKEQAREQALVAAEDAKFYSYTEEVPMMGYGLPNGPSVPSENVEVPKRSSARELISLFNAIGNVTKVTVNSTFFSKEEIKKRFSFMSENVKTVEQTITVEEKAFEQKSASSRQSLIIDFNSPPSSRKRFENVTSFQTSPEVSADSSVTITEIKEQAPTKPRAFQSPNPSIPTITEQSESATTTPASTPGDVTKTVVKNTSEVPEALSRAKQITIWSCPRCTLENPSWKITCEACGRWRPTFSERPHNGLPLFNNANSSCLFPDNSKRTDLSAEVRSSVASANAEQGKMQDANSEQNTSSKQVAVADISLEHEKPAKEINSEIKPQNKSEDNRGMDVNKQAAASVTITNEKEIIMNKYLGKPNAPKSSVNHQSNNIISKSEESNKNQILKDDKCVSASNFKKESIKKEKTTTVSDMQNEETVNVDEVRMARLAFFNNVESQGVDTNTDKPDTEKQKTIHDADERARLKEMLKEMKNSLPKRPNKLNVGTSNKEISNDVRKHENDEGRKLGAIKKVINKPQETTPQIPASNGNNNSDINAVLITTKTVYDDIKVKRNSSSKSPKVSTSVQTNAAIVQKILQDDSEKKKNTKTRGKKSSAEVIVPITVQEFSGTGIKDGVLYTSLKKDSRRLGKGTFELIHAKDFASIEATKTGSENTAVHVYANLPPTSPIAHAPSPPVQSKQQSKMSNGIISDDSKSMQVPLSRPDSNEVEKLTAQLTFQKGIDDFKADLKTSPPEKGMNTLAINRLLRRLEMAIANGEHNQAAILAKDLAKLKINCSVIRQRQSSTNPTSITVDMYVEDKISHQGPIPLRVVPTMTVGQLKQKVQKEFEIPAGVQRWILGKLLASDDSKTLADHNVNTTGCPLFLYLVAPDGEQNGNTDAAEKKQTVENVEKPTENDETANRTGGWFYNDEEDRYSFCEDTESSEEEQGEEIREDVKKVTNPAPVFTNADENSDDEEEEEDEEEEGEESEEENELENAAAVVVIHEKPVVLQAPVVATPFVPPKLAILTAKENTAQAANVEENIATATWKEAEKSSTLKLGWKCPVCTLVNSPTRPGCAACTTERPQNYIIPKEYEANDRERLRLRQEQTLDNELQQARDEEKRKEAEKQQQSYLQLINLDKEDLVPNAEPFDCSVCLTQYNIDEGVVLRECLHTFCRTCLINTVQFSEEAEVKCPYRDADYACASALQEREIKALVPREVYEQHLAKSVAQAENKIGNAFHCKTPDCRGWCIFEDNVNEFKCPVCRSTNCLTCQAIHDGMNCKQYQEQMNQESETNADARRTKEMLEEMVERGEAMNCPTCQVVLMKKWGCDWLRCSMCKTEICWVTRGPRWGPGGKGDTSGGCQCGLNGIKCHPRCNYCH